MTHREAEAEVSEEQGTAGRLPLKLFVKIKGATEQQYIEMMSDELKVLSAILNCNPFLLKVYYVITTGTPIKTLASQAPTTTSYAVQRTLQSHGYQLRSICAISSLQKLPRTS